MWSAVWRLEVRKTVPWCLAVLAVCAAYVLLAPDPLGSWSRPALALGTFLGLVLAARLFADPAGTQPFVFSLPLSRERLFLYRWTLGLSLQVVVLGVLAILMACGIRQALQTSISSSPWYPMVRYYELTVLWAFGLGSLLAYQASVFGVVLRWRSLQRGRRGGRRPPIGTSWLTVVPMVAVACGVAAWIAWDMDLRGGPGDRRWRLLLWSYAALVVMLTTAAARHCHGRVEVEA